MAILVLCAAWAAGVLINALADSLPHRQTPRRPNCRACGAPRPWLARSGVLAFVTRQRRCVYCAHLDGWRAPVVEFACVVAGAWLLDRNPQLWSVVRDGLILAVFVLIVVIDVEHRLILLAVALPASVAIAVVQSLDPQRGPVKTLVGGLVGFVTFYLLYLLGGLFARGIARARGRSIEEVAFGFGDVMLAMLIGVTVGWAGVVVALFLGILAAGLFSLAYILVMLGRRRYTAFLPIPYGPFMVLGALLVYFGGRTAFERLVG